jgi:DNA-directed RNA polymerase sigma subunit (sigma70/sigma32)
MDARYLMDGLDRDELLVSSGLDDDELRVLALRVEFGLTRRQVAYRMRLSESRVRTIERHALMKVRARLREGWSKGRAELESRVFRHSVPTGEADVRR